VLNQKGLPRTEIDSGYSSYPRERVRQAGVNKAATIPLLTLVKSREFASVGSAYLAPPGSFVYLHRVIMVLSLYSGSTLARRVTFDSSRRQDWPPSLKRVVDEVFRLGRLTGPLPAGPMID